MENPEEARDEALSFLVDHREGVLSTVSAEGQPRSRLLYYTCDDSFNIFFITLANTRKVADLAAHPKAAFVVSDTETPQTLQVEGEVKDLTETATNDPLIVGFFRELQSHKKYGIPLEHLDSAVIKIYRLSPSWIRWGHFTFGRGSDAVLTLIDPKEPSQA